MRNIIISVFATLLLLTQGVSAESLSAKRFDPQASEKADSLYNEAHRAYANGNYEKAITLYKESFEYKKSRDICANIGNAYDEIGDYNNAIKWYTIGIKEFNDQASAFNLGKLFEKRKEYTKASKWFKKSFELGYSGGGNSLAILYQKENNNKDAIKWYKKAIKKGHINARKNLGLLYHKLGDDLHSAVYMMGMIGHPYTKERVMGLLRNTWKIDEPTLKKAYELQKKLVPDPYTGGIE